MTDRRVPVSRALSTIGLLAAAWSVAIALTRGFVVGFGPVHFSSRNARNPAIAALVLLAASVMAAPAGARWRTVRGELARAGRFVASLSARPIELADRPAVATGAVALLVVLTLAVSWFRGAYIMGGSDSYGYVSEAHLFATGRLHADAPLIGAFPHVPSMAVTPLGYRPADDGSRTLVPVYSPGLPLTMAPFERVFGPSSVYAVLPLLSALAVWCTFRMGVHLAGSAAGAGAALLLFASPAMLFQAVGAPMSDGPAMGWLILGLLLLVKRPTSPWMAMCSGLAIGMAILTRPNLVLVAVPPGLLLLYQVVTASAGRRQALTRLGSFSSSVVAACLVVAWLNTVWNGSPLRSGYGAGLFSASYWSVNIVRFATWLTETQTPLLLLGYAAPLVVGFLPSYGRRDRTATVWLLCGTAFAVFASYLFYLPFGAWWFLRFLLPAFPPLAVLACITLAALTARLGAAMRVFSVAVVLASSVFGLSYAYHDSGLNPAGEYRYRIIAEWLRDHLPRRSIVLAMQHSGSINHYSGLPIVRYDLLSRDNYEPALDELIAAGYHPYLVVDQFEVGEVRRLHGEDARGRIDWPPIAVLPLGNVTVWDLAEDRDAAKASGRKPQLIPIPDFVVRRLN